MTNTPPTASPSGSWHNVARRSELDESYPTRAKVGERDIAISVVEGQVYATSNICSHAYALLSDGYVEGFEIMCPLHGGSFDVRTGEAISPPCQVSIAAYICRIVGDEVQVLIDEDDLDPSDQASLLQAKG